MNLVFAFRSTHPLVSTFIYFSGRHAGTPLHHAAKRGLESIVKLLLRHGGIFKCLYISNFM